MTDFSELERLSEAVLVLKVTSLLELRARQNCRQSKHLPEISLPHPNPQTSTSSRAKHPTKGCGDASNLTNSRPSSARRALTRPRQPWCPPTPAFAPFPLTSPQFAPSFYDDDDDGPMAGMLRRPGAGGPTRRFDEYYRCYPVAMLPGPERDNVNYGGKVILPPSALDKLTRMHIVYPMMFELVNGAKERTSHAGVLEFIAEEGKIYVPFWVSARSSPPAHHTIRGLARGTGG